MEIEHDSVDCMISLEGECHLRVYVVRWSRHQAGVNSGYCVLWQKKCENHLSERIIFCHEKVQADSCTESDIVDFITGLGRWRETSVTEEGDQNTREKRKATDSSMSSPSACLSWFVYWEKKASHVFVIKTQPGFSRDFISKSSLDAEANAHRWLRQSLWNIQWMVSTFAVVI